MTYKYVVSNPQNELHMMEMEDVQYQNIKGADLQILSRVVFITTLQDPQEQYGPDYFRMVRTDDDKEYVLFADESITVWSGPLQAVAVADG